MLQVGNEELMSSALDCFRGLAYSGQPIDFSLLLKLRQSLVRGREAIFTGHNPRLSIFEKIIDVLNTIDEITDEARVKALACLSVIAYKGRS